MRPPDFVDELSDILTGYRELLANFTELKVRAERKVPNRTRTTRLAGVDAAINDLNQKIANCEQILRVAQLQKRLTQTLMD